MSLQLQKTKHRKSGNGLFEKTEQLFIKKLMKTIKQFIFFSVLLFAATGCFDDIAIHGNGIAATEERLVSAFDKVKSAGDFEIHITKGDVSEVVINADQNIISYIETSVSENTLLIDIPGWHNVINKLPMKVYITIPTLTGVKQSGSGNITTDYFSCDNMELFISGSGSISTAVNANSVDASISGSGWMKISGDANQSNLSISGSGNIGSYNLLVNSCNANISGSGNIQVNSVKSILAKISGSGNIYYTGNPIIEINISGSGKVIHSI